MLTGPLEPVSNKATWVTLYELRDDETGELIDLSTLTDIKVQIRDPRKSVLLTASLTGGGVEIVDLGVFKWTFSASQMNTLPGARTYEVGCLLEGYTKVQLLIGTLPVLDGIVR